MRQSTLVRTVCAGQPYCRYNGSGSYSSVWEDKVKSSVSHDRPLDDWPQLAPDQLFDLTSRVALVTGAAGGIGQWLAAGLAAAGAAVILSDTDQERLSLVEKVLKAGGAQCATIIADLAVPEECEELMRSAARTYDRLDILVNCAGTNSRRPVLEVDHQVYEGIMAVNLRAPFLLSQLAAREMIGARGGAIVHVGSVNSAQGLAGVSVYGAAKAGLSQLTRVQAIEWAPLGIRVNCLAPGFIRTPLSAPLFAERRTARWIQSRVPAGRAGHPDELVGLLLLLASDAGGFITGQTFYADGGFLAGSDWGLR
jgi:NAD(P)-dependent dehydrogenase (short-subunit alcohol dehydrogenase family)